MRAAPVLLETANNAKNTAMLRASAITQLGRLLPERLAPSLPLWLESNDPLIRLAAAEAAGQLPPEQQLERLMPLSKDPVLAVRMVAAEQLAGLVPPTAGAPDLGDTRPLPGQQPSAEGQPQAAGPLDALFSEYVRVQSQHLDMPSVLTQLSGFQQARGDGEAAEALLVSALEKNPQASASRVNLADLYRAQGKEEAARTTLESGVKLNQEDASLWFSLALLEVREGNGESCAGGFGKSRLTGRDTELLPLRLRRGPARPGPSCRSNGNAESGKPCRAGSTECARGAHAIQPAKRRHAGSPALSS